LAGLELETERRRPFVDVDFDVADSSECSLSTATRLPIRFVEDVVIVVDGLRLGDDVAAKEMLDLVSVYDNWESRLRLSTDNRRIRRRY